MSRQSSPQVFRLDPAGLAASEARRHVRELAVGALRPDELDSAVLLTSELVTNAVLHGSGAVTLSVSSTPGSIRVEVTDESDDQPAMQSMDTMALGGRGMHLVDELAHRWGVNPRVDGDPGKTVWFVLP